MCKNWFRNQYMFKHSQGRSAGLDSRPPFVQHIHIIQNCQVYNYADDNTICDSDTDLNKLKANLKAKSEDAIDWFHQNAMVANPDKFQARNE